MHYEAGERGGVAHVFVFAPKEDAVDSAAVLVTLARSRLHFHYALLCSLMMKSQCCPLSLHLYFTLKEIFAPSFMHTTTQAELY